MGLLNADQRNALPEHAFALPGRRYPYHDEAHARAALSRVSANGTPAEQATVRSKVHARFPGIALSAGQGMASLSKRAV